MHLLGDCSRLADHYLLERRLVGCHQGVRDEQVEGHRAARRQASQGECPVHRRASSWPANKTHYRPVSNMPRSTLADEPNWPLHRKDSLSLSFPASFPCTASSSLIAFALLFLPQHSSRVPGRRGRMDGWVSRPPPSLVGTGLGPEPGRRCHGRRGFSCNLVPRAACRSCRHL